MQNHRRTCESGGVSPNTSYSYWHTMQASPDGKYWGNGFRPESQPNIERGKWICVELMLQHNTPGKDDGEQRVIMAVLVRSLAIGIWIGYLQFLAMSGPPAETEIAFPKESWATRMPDELGLDELRLEKFSQQVGGDGCIIRYGYLAHRWGEVMRHKDWASAAKPVLSTLLMLAVADGRLPSVDSPLKDLGWELKPKDRSMTFRHLANMVSGYALAEAPGTAWGYNDFSIQLYAKSLERIYEQPLDTALRERLALLQFEDGELMGSRDGGGVTASSRDFARLAWLWLNRGRWGDLQVIPAAIFDDCVCVGVAGDVPRAKAATDDYLQIGSYGGGTDQTPYGPGVYGFNFWFNEKLENGQRVWPALPADTYQANGLWNRDTVTIIPSLQMVIVSRAAKPGAFRPGDETSEYNQNVQLLMQAVVSDSAQPKN